jgi:hypothetical protein
MRYKIFVCLMSIMCLLMVQAAFSAQNGLVLYLPFNGNINDESDNKFAVELKGNESYTGGKFGKAFEFDGATYLAVQDEKAGTFDGTPGLTIGVWTIINAHHNNGIVVKLIVAGQHWPCSYNLETWSDQLAYFDVDADAGKYATASYPLNEWFYLVGVFDGSKGEDRIYINGKLENSNPRAVKTVPDGDQPVYIGCVAPATYPFIGALDELVIYNRALTDAEIKANMQGINMAVDKIGKLSATWATIKSQN